MARAALVALITALAAAACGGSEEVVAPSPRTVTVTVTEPAPPAPIEETSADAEPLPSEASEATTFDGTYFSIDYPADWDVETAEVSKGSYLDTTIRDPVEPEVMVRIDVSPETFSDPATVAAEVEEYLVDQPGYRRLRYEPRTFHGYDAFQWDFVVEEDGVLVRKSDIFFTTDAGDGVAVLIQAPARGFRAHRADLERVRGSLAAAGESVESAPESEQVDSSEFCATHECIDNFEEGRGYAVQCEDGTWSQSGGIQGACSHHGGVAGGTGSSPSVGDDIDDNGDGSTTNWCGASRDGDGDGLWCEGQ